MRTYKKLLEERATLNSVKQQIFLLNKSSDLSEITNKINKISEEIRTLNFNNIKNEKEDNTTKSSVPDICSITYNDFIKGNS